MVMTTAIPESIKAVVAQVLRNEMKKGSTTKQTVLLLVMQKLETGNGQRNYGLSPSLLHVMAKNALAEVVAQQMKSHMPDNVIHHACRNAPPEVVQMMTDLPAWIAVGEGPEAPWVPSLQATIAQWLANAEMKNKKATQTVRRAEKSTEIADYLKQYGLRCLGDLQSDAA